jgi:peroxiredoxin
VHVFAISRDSPWSHTAWRQSLAVDVTLLSDWAGEATDAFGVATSAWGMTVSRRSAFLVGADGTVRATWAYDGRELPDLDEIVVAARSLYRSAPAPSTSAPRCW